MPYADWIPTYPDVSDPLFQQKIATKKEFSDVAAPYQEDPPSKPGDLFKYQIFDKRYMRAYDRLLMFYEAGTGKTCAYVSVTEDFNLAAQQRMSVLADALTEYYNSYQGTIKKIIILLKGKSLSEELSKQLVCKCTPGTYITESLIKARSDKSQKSAVTRAISKVYEISTYTTFTRKITDSKWSDEKIADEFNGTLFVCDEIHSLKTELKSKKKNTEEEAEDDEEDPDIDIPNKKHDYEKVYSMLWKLFHLPPWCKVICATATPMINNANDLIDPMNLLLPKTKQIPKNTNLINWPLEKYKEYMMGYISFVRAGDTGVDTVFTGSPLDRMFTRSDGTPDPSQMNVEKYKMSDFQSKVYLEVIGKKAKAFRNAERQVAAFVFPDGTYGGKFERDIKQREDRKKALKGISKYIISPRKNDYKRTPEWNNATNTIDKIRKLSCLYAEIIEQCMKAPGLCFIYEELLHGSGGIALAMCFESMGFTRFKDDFSAFESNTGKQAGYKIAPYCAGEKGDRRIRIDKQLRYGMITSETNENQDAKLKEVYNSEENKYGEYVKILIGSKLTRDGINLANVQDVFLPSMWTPAGMYQAMQRAIRATSHISLVKESKTGRVDVRVHRMACYAKQDNKIVSVDLDMFAIAERKDREIAIVRRNVRKIAGDCIVQRDRNMPEGPELDYTAICDYDLCSFPCVNQDPDPDQVDLSTYRMLYSQEEIKDIYFYMSFAFSVVSHFSMKDFSTTYEKDQIILYMAVHDAVKKRMEFTNRYGQTQLIAVQGDHVFLVPPRVIQPSYPDLDNYYSSVLIAEQTVPLRDFIVKRTDISAVIGNEDQGGLKSIDVNILLLENAVLKPESKRTNDEKTILKRFKNYLYEMKIPVAELSQEEERQNNRGKGRGRKAIEGKVPYYKDPLDPDKAETGDKVYVHTMYTIPMGDTSFAVSAKFLNPKGRLRIYNPLEGHEWRDMNLYEQVVYNAIIRGRIQKTLKPYIDSKLYGTVLSDNVFRIVDIKDQEDTLDERYKNRGRVCSESSWQVDDLILIGYRIGASPPIDFNTKKPRGYDLSKDEIINDLIKLKEFEKHAAHLKKHSLEELRYIYAFIKSNFSRPGFCQHLQKRFKELNRLFEA